MRGLLSKEPGGPDTLVMDELPDPIAGPGQVIVAVKACSINYPDVLIIERQGDRHVWWTYAGGAANNSLAAAISELHADAEHDSLSVRWTSGEPLEVRKLSGDLLGIDADFFGGHDAGVDEPGNITWFGFDGTRFIPLNLPVGNDGAAIMPEPTSGLAADGDPIPKSAGRYRVEDDVQWLAAGDRLDDHVQPIAVVSENEGSHIDNRSRE